MQQRERADDVTIQQLLCAAVCCYGTQLHTILVHGTLEALFFFKCSLFESYVLNLSAVNQLRDANTNFRIDYTFQ